jgi:hypothetical protein
LISAQKTQDIIEGNRLHETDTGSSEVQIALLTERINQLQTHFESWACAARRGRSGTSPEGRATHNERGGPHGMWESVIREAPAGRTRPQR